MASHHSVIVRPYPTTFAGHDLSHLPASAEVDLKVFYTPTPEGIDIALASLASAYIEATEELQARRLKKGTHE